MSERPNYYLLLELDPSVDDWDVIDKHLRTCRIRWSGYVTQGPPKRKVKAQACLEQLGSMQSVLQDPESRRAEASAARQILEKERIAELATLDQKIALLKAGGQCSRKQLATLSKRAKMLTPKEVEERIAKAGILLERPAEAASAKRAKAPECLDPAIRGELRNNLDAIGKNNLYGFLGLAETSSPRALRNAAKALGRRLQALGGIDVRSTASKALVGHCEVIFADAAAKQRYDNTLAAQALDTLQEPLELVGAEKRFLTAHEVDTLVGLARDQGVSADEARQHIEEYAAKRKWGVQTILEPQESDPLPAADEPLVQNSVFGRWSKKHLTVAAFLLLATIVAAIFYGIGGEDEEKAALEAARASTAAFSATGSAATRGADQKRPVRDPQGRPGQAVGERSAIDALPGPPGEVAPGRAASAVGSISSGELPRTRSATSAVGREVGSSTEPGPASTRRAPAPTKPRTLAQGQGGHTRRGKKGGAVRSPRATRARSSRPALRQPKGISDSAHQPSGTWGITTGSIRGGRK